MSANLNPKFAGHATIGGKGPGNVSATSRQTTSDKSLGKNKAHGHQTTGGKGPAKFNAAGHPTTGGKSIERLKELGVLNSTKETKTLAAATNLADFQEIATSLGIEATGTKPELTVRIILHNLQLGTPEHRHRLNSLLALSQADLKTRLKALNILSKDKAKVDLARRILETEAKMGGYPCLEGDEGYGSNKQDPLSTANKKSTPPTSCPPNNLLAPTKQGIKRKLADTDAVTDHNEDKPLKHVRLEESTTSKANNEAHIQDSAPIILMEKPYRIPKRNSNNVRQMGVADKGVKRKHEDEDQPPSHDDNFSSKRQKQKPSAVDPKALGTFSQIKKKPAKPGEDPTEECYDHFVFNDKLDTRTLLEHRPKSFAVLNAITRILTGQARADDVAIVAKHRQTLPKFAIYTDPEKTFELKSKDDRDWLDVQEYWELKEVEATRFSIGGDHIEREDVTDEPTPAIKSPVSNKDSAQARTEAARQPGARIHPHRNTREEASRIRSLKIFYAKLDEPEADDTFTKGQIVHKRKVELLSMIKRGVTVEDLECMDIHSQRR